MGRSKILKAIDLYSGVGGWALGLRLAGIDVVASYDLSGAANETNFKNNHHQAQTVDIRRLSLDEIPSAVDIVVGSPPCTQFSFANRGGNGNIADGLKDIVKFLTVVDHIRPKFWAMENVPRVAKIIEHELRAGGRLRRFRHLGLTFQIVNMEDFGLPQRRNRCIVGNIPFDLLSAYSRDTRKRTLGAVVKALSSRAVHDPIYGVRLRRDHLRDHVFEEALDLEEVRINRANKACHPVYNAMPFPDQLSRSVRTITATCTRVCRESIVISDRDHPTRYRRLTIRERASLQGFPITFQFYASSYRKKLEMVGNAMPPLFSYYIGHAMKSTSPTNVPKVTQLASLLGVPAALAEETRPEKRTTRYQPNRRFRFAIPSLRLKSGVRFELANSAEENAMWEVNFFFGTSKSIHSISLERALATVVLRKLPSSARGPVEMQLDRLGEFIRSADVGRLQQVWTHRGPGRTTPFMVLDALDECGREVGKSLSRLSICPQILAELIEKEFAEDREQPVGVPKLLKNAPTILAGILVGSIANPLLKFRRIGATLGGAARAG
ncbi:DNA cytosine methyltransferase [Bradyrhizobium sp. TM233]|uniref:DNA cytosine methyltransferase n=1 Tax=Bradyrhizobium sp. TM233 TaxID=2599801 RepID=UPI0030C74C29